MHRFAYWQWARSGALIIDSKSASNLEQDTSEMAFQSWLHKIMVIEPFFNGLSPFSTIFHRALCKINSQTHLKFIQGAAAPNEPYFNSTYTMKITIVNLINLSEAIYHTNVPLLKCNKWITKREDARMIPSQSVTNGPTLFMTTHLIINRSGIFYHCSQCTLLVSIVFIYKSFAYSIWIS